MIRALFLKPDAKVQPNVTTEELPDLLAIENGLLWVDLALPGESERPVLKDVFDFHALALEDCFDHRIESPKIDDYGRSLFIVPQSVAFYGPAERLELVEVDIFLGPNYVVTVRQ